MAMGYNAAANIYQQLLQTHYDREPKFVEWPEIPPAMGLAIGKNAVCFGGPDGVVFGEEQMKLMLWVFTYSVILWCFKEGIILITSWNSGDDLGFSSKSSQRHSGLNSTLSIIC